MVDVFLFLFYPSFSDALPVGASNIIPVPTPCAFSTLLMIDFRIVVLPVPAAPAITHIGFVKTLYKLLPALSKLLHILPVLYQLANC